ncbi:MAG: lysine 2,3-aminomutase, partial [Hyphomicrobiales bacterium]|nr:lysine 2,3-aminomutase [Hyphomicrobiales bacterium]
MKPARKTLRRPDELVAAGLIAHERRGEIEAVAARYALALTAEV